MPQKIQVRRGLQSDLPMLDEGEVGFTLDTKRLFVGTSLSGNVELTKTSQSHQIAYVIELERWGIKQGSFGKPPYSADEWATAYNNILGMNAALTHAKNNWYNRVIVPKGVYSFCYSNSNAAATAPYNMVDLPIKLFSNQTLDLNGSTFEVLYDSINRNPYDLGSTPVWKLSGTLISLEDCKNSHVTNGTIIGDIPNRSFSDGGSMYESEEGMEQTNAISMDRGARFCSASYLDISMFMGDGIQVGCYPTYENWNISGYENSTCLPGYVGDDGDIVAQAGSYVSNKYTLTPGNHKVIQMRTGGGYTRIVPIKGRTFEFVFLNSSNIVVKRKKAVYLQLVTVPHDATGVRIQLLNESVGLASVDPDFHITKPQASNIHIHNCDIHNNHRGGISGGADYTLVEFNRIFHNGLDSGIGIPEFVDSTRYCINFEDSYSNEVIIRDNIMFSGFNGLLIGAYHVTIKGNIMYEFAISGVLVYNNAKINVEDNLFYNAGSLGLMSTLSSQERIVIFHNNHVLGGGMSVQPTDKTKVHITNNKLAPSSMTLIGEVHFSDNRVDSPTSNTPCTIRVTKCVDNTFENLNVNVQPFDSKSIVSNNTYKSCAVKSSTSVNEAEYYDSVFTDSTIEQLQVADKSKSSSLSFTDCRFHDTRIAMANMYQNDTTNGNLTVACKLKRCKIKMSELSTIAWFFGISDNVAKASYANGVTPRIYEITYSDCEFDNSKSPIVNYVVNNDTSDRTRNLLMDRCTINTTTFKLFNDVATNTAVLKNMYYLGNSVPPAMTLAKVESYNETLTPSGTSYPSSLTPMVGSCWFNTTTKKPYWWNGTAWVDATGATI